MTAVNPKQIARANESALNQAALAWLKKAEQNNPPAECLHVLALATWGAENGARAPGLDEDQNASLLEALNRMCVKEPEPLLRWLSSNPDGPDDLGEQRRSLMSALGVASSPENAAEMVLEALASRLAAQSPYYRPAASELT